MEFELSVDFELEPDCGPGSPGGAELPPEFDEAAAGALDLESEGFCPGGPTSDEPKVRSLPEPNDIPPN